MVKFFLPGPLSFFVKESSALQCGGTRSPSRRRSIKHLGVNGKWPGAGGERSVSGYSDAARGSGCPGAPPSRLASAAQPSTLGRISAGREAPPRARPQEGGREPRGRAGGQARGRGPPRDALPGDAGMRCSRLGDPRNRSALPGQRWNEQLPGCTPRLLSVTGTSWKAYRLCLALNIKVQSSGFFFFS